MADLAAPQEFWADKWDSKMTGWKVGEALNTHVRAYELLANLGIMKEGQPARIMVPLAGDGIFSPFAYAHGHTVVASELVGSAVESLRARFNEGVAACRGLPAREVAFRSAEESGLVRWESLDGRATIWQGDFFRMQEQPEGFDLLFDKDAFGALPFELRAKYVATLAPLVKPGGHVFLEVKDKSADPDTSVRTKGPPYHVSEEDVKEHWHSNGFETIDYLSAFCPLPYAHWKEHVFILRKKA